MTLDLPRTFANIDTSKFEESLLDELRYQAHKLPLEGFCVEGGWPDEDTLELEIVTVARDDDGLTYVTVGCEFDEATPTGCADIHRTSSAFGRFIVILYPADQSAEIEEHRP